MPLQQIELNKPQSGRALWHITETAQTLIAMAEGEKCPDDITNPEKRLEFLAGRILLRQLVENAGLVYHGIYKDKFGKPYLNVHSHAISLSHSFPYVAAQLDKDHLVGIDIEQPKEKLLRISHRVFSPAELEDMGGDVIKNCVYWCAKESLYKIYGRRGLSFAEHLEVRPFKLAKAGSLTGLIHAEGSNTSHALQYEVAASYVLVFTKP